MSIITKTEWETITNDPRFTAADDDAANNLRALAAEVLGSERSWAALKLARNMIDEGVRADMAIRLSLRNAAPREDQP
jgi:hypothetical protein